MSALEDERIEGAMVQGGTTIASEPYPWPFDGDFGPHNTALVIIDMQTDFCAPGRLRRLDGLRHLADPRANRADRPRAGGVPCHGLSGDPHPGGAQARSQSDLPANKRWRSQRIGAGIGDQGPCGRILVRGEAGWEIIPELQPVTGEAIIDKPGKGSFLATDFDLVLQTRRVRNIVLTGVTTDVCVHTTMRDANDRGYECLVLSDCTAATKYENHLAALDMIKMQGGVFGAVATSTQLLEALP